MIDPDVKAVVDELALDVLGWESNFATVECPGAHLHRNPGNTARLYTSPILFLHCLHQSCASVVASFNDELWDYNDRLPERERPKPTPAQKEERAFRKHLRRISAIAHGRLLPTLPERNEDYWLSTSPYPVDTVPMGLHYKLFLSALYPPDALVWCGEKHESSSPKNGINFGSNFRSVTEWCALSYPQGQQTSLVSFSGTCRKNGQRRKEHLARRYYHVLESDELSQPKAGGVLEWARKYVKLRAIVDTGGKSWHGLIEPLDYATSFKLVPKPAQEIPVRHELEPFRPGVQPGYWMSWERNENYEAELAEWNRKHGEAHAKFWRELGLCSRRIREFNAMAIGLGCDRNMLCHSLTARLPGAERLDKDFNSTGKFQRLVWLDPAYEIKL